MPTPVLYESNSAALPIDKAPAERRQTDLDLLYVTDRRPETEGEEPYGQERSRSLAFGEVSVHFTGVETWEDLLTASQTNKRADDVNLTLGEPVEMGRFPEEPYPVRITSEGVYRDDESLAAHRDTLADFRALMDSHLQHAPSREVVLFVHGFHETFESAAYTIAELCHFLGRQDVCISFTWPASSSGSMLTSYSFTTESAEYSTSHLRKTIRMIASLPEVKALHLIAHSRGTALLLGALHDLIGEAISFGVSPSEQFKLDNVILVAPDVDSEVAMQKVELFASDPDLLSRWEEDVLPEVLGGRMTIYTSPLDRALLVSKILYRSTRRLGLVDPDNLPEEDLERIRKWGQVDVIIDQSGRDDRFGHLYYKTDPDTSSDLIQLIRTGAHPSAPERGLDQIAPFVWAVPD